MTGYTGAVLSLKPMGADQSLKQYSCHHVVFLQRIRNRSILFDLSVSYAKTLLDGLTYINFY